jgi:hypothetical protein
MTGTPTFFWAGSVTGFEACIPCLHASVVIETVIPLGAQAKIDKEGNWDGCRLM